MELVSGSCWNYQDFFRYWFIKYIQFSNLSMVNLSAKPRWQLKTFYFIEHSRKQINWVYTASRRSWYSGIKTPVKLVHFTNTENVIRSRCWSKTSTWNDLFVEHQQPHKKHSLALSKLSVNDAGSAWNFKHRFFKISIYCFSVGFYFFGKCTVMHR